MKIFEKLFNADREKKTELIDELLKKYLPNVKIYKLRLEILNKFKKQLDDNNIDPEYFSYLIERDIKRRINRREEMEKYHTNLIAEERKNKESVRQESAGQNAESSLDWLRKNIRTSDYEIFTERLDDFKINQKISSKNLDSFGTSEEEIAKFEKLAQKKTKEHEFVLSSYGEQLEEAEKANKPPKSAPKKNRFEQAA